MLNKADKKWIIEIFDKKFDQKFDQKFDRKFDEKFDEKFEELRHFVWDSIATFKDEILSVLHPLQETSSN